MDDKLFTYFVGKQVNIIMKSIKGSQRLSDGSTVQGNVVMEGVLLDADNDFYYLSGIGDEIDQALKKTDVIRVFLDDENIVFEGMDGSNH